MESGGRFLVFILLVVSAIGWCLTDSVSAQATVTPAVQKMTVTGFDEYGPHLPPNITPEGSYGHKADQLINILHYFMFVLFGGWGIFFVYCLVKFRQGAHARAVYEPVKAKPSKYLEVGVIVFEAALLVLLSIPIWKDARGEVPQDKDAIKVRVLAEQFAWNFHYPGPDGVFGVSAPQFINLQTNPVGKDPEDANGKDDIVTKELFVPLNRTMIAEITSKDVIHSFAVPVLRVKQDAIPGMRIPVWFQAAKAGTYQIACAQLCGSNHYNMLAPMIVGTDKEFADWVALKSKAPEVFEGD